MMRAAATEEHDGMSEFAGKVALVTGGATGIGKAIAFRLAAGGAQVVICGRRAETLEAAVAEGAGAGLALAGRPADVTVGAEMAALVAFVEERCGGLDVLVNNAGVGTFGSVVETPEDEWRAAMAINLDGVFLAAKHAIPAMRRRGGGAIVNIASVHGFATIGPRIAYVTSKTALLGMTRGMALNHAADGIRVNAVCPGPVATPMLRDSWAKMFPGRSPDEVLAAQGKKLPIGRLGRPEDIAEAVAFLASPRAAFITGTDLKVDGGLLAMLALTPPEIV
jgi:NAD(P)-dependent dehydrogenase (short-subunit alcohol dehydrogenase family)